MRGIVLVLLAATPALGAESFMELAARGHEQFSSERGASMQAARHPIGGEPGSHQRHAGETPSKSFRAMGWINYGAKACDVVTTELILAQPHGVEHNPLMQDRGVRIASAVAIAWFVNESTDFLYRRGHTRAAWIIRTVLTGAHVGLTAHNARELR